MPSFERHVLALMAGLALALSDMAEAADETLVRAFLSRRLGIAENPQLDPNELSRRELQGHKTNGWRE